MTGYAPAQQSGAAEQLTVCCSYQRQTADGHEVLPLRPPVQAEETCSAQGRDSYRASAPRSVRPWLRRQDRIKTAKGHPSSQRSRGPLGGQESLKLAVRAVWRGLVRGCFRMELRGRG